MCPVRNQKPPSRSVDIFNVLLESQSLFGDGDGDGDGRGRRGEGVGGDLI